LAEYIMIPYLVAIGRSLLMSYCGMTDIIN
jgi:hypothetical protein